MITVGDAAEVVGGAAVAVDPLADRRAAVDPHAHLHLEGVVVGHFDTDVGLAALVGDAALVLHLRLLDAAGRPVLLVAEQDHGRVAGQSHRRLAVGAVVAPVDLLALVACALVAFGFTLRRLHRRHRGVQRSGAGIFGRGGRGRQSPRQDDGCGDCSKSGKRLPDPAGYAHAYSPFPCSVELMGKALLGVVSQARVNYTTTYSLHQRS